MTAHAPRLSFPFHLLIREAKDRAGRRRALLIVAWLVIGLGAAGAGLAFSAASGRPARPASSPFGWIEGGQGAGEVTTGAIVHFIPNAPFQVGLELANLSDRTVIVTNVRAVEPPHSFVHQTGTALLHWHVPRPLCNSNIECMPVVEGFDMQPITTPAPPRPLEVKPGNGEWRLGVQLDYRTGTCAELSAANRQSPSRLLITFHTPNGPTQHEVVRLRRYQLYLPHRHPRAGVCQQQR